MTSKERVKGSAIAYEAEQVRWDSPSRVMTHLRSLWDVRGALDLMHCGKREA